ncbi:MAG: hypothetical protein L0H19_04125 [Salinisphaera sp.]|nr:hypothetical protein [Salinisphaera sp.]
MSASQKHLEARFEEAIEQALVDTGGYERRNADDFNAELGLFPDELLAFVQNTQPKPWQALAEFHGDKAGEALIDALVKELASKGALNVLRHGFKCFGKGFRLAWFRPNTGMNPEALAVTRPIGCGSTARCTIRP